MSILSAPLALVVLLFCFFLLFAVVVDLVKSCVSSFTLKDDDHVGLEKKKKTQKENENIFPLAEKNRVINTHLALHLNIPTTTHLFSLKDLPFGLAPARNVAKFEQKLYRKREREYTKKKRLKKDDDTNVVKIEGKPPDLQTQ